MSRSRPPRDGNDHGVLCLAEVVLLAVPYDGHDEDVIVVGDSTVGKQSASIVSRR
jgi:hypothetical protein